MVIHPANRWGWIGWDGLMPEHMHAVLNIQKVWVGGGLKFVLSAASFVTSTGGERILNTSRILPAWIGCPCVFSLLCFRENKATSSKTWLVLVMSKMSYTRLYNCSEFSKLICHWKPCSYLSRFSKVNILSIGLYRLKHGVIISGFRRSLDTTQRHIKTQTTVGRSVAQTIWIFSPFVQVPFWATHCNFGDVTWCNQPRILVFWPCHHWDHRDSTRGLETRVVVPAAMFATMRWPSHAKKGQTLWLPWNKLEWALNPYGSVSKPCTPGEHQNSW